MFDSKQKKNFDLNHAKAAFGIKGYWLRIRKNKAEYETPPIYANKSSYTGPVTANYNKLYVYAGCE